MLKNSIGFKAVKTAIDDEESFKDHEDKEKAELNEQIMKLKEKCEQLVKEKENLENEIKKKIVSDKNILAVGFIF